MQAMHGSAVPFRSRGRLIGACLAVVLVLGALFASAASARPVSKTYLALGDSLAFGYSQQLYNENMAEGDPATAFEHGYVNDYAAHLKSHTQYQTLNLGCPGETTASLIGNGPLGKGLEASEFKATTEAPCGYQEAWNAFHSPGAGGPLHVPYVGKSQLEAAIEQVAIGANPAVNRPVEVVTLNIGANDQLHVVNKCKAEVKAEFEAEGKSKYGGGPEEAVLNCLTAHVFSLGATIIKNTEAAAFALRHAHSVFGIPGAVDYTGKIIFLASYDPFGVVFKAGEPIGPGGVFGTGTGKQLLPGSIGLAEEQNSKEALLFSQAFNPEKEEFGFEACVANALKTFNPQNKTEPTKLQKYTNMANFTEFAGKHYGQEGADGPDIHPTPEGYAKLAQIIKKACH